MLDILVIDDEASIRLGLSCLLSQAGHCVSEAADGAEALALISSHVYDVVISDVRLPQVQGFTLLDRLHEISPSTDVILMTAFARVADAVKAIRRGAVDYVSKPFDPESFPLPVINLIAERRMIENKLKQARAQLGGETGRSIIGQSPTMIRLLASISLLAESEAPVLITGETGTGKELIAHALHGGSSRRLKPFVVVNCAALPEALLEAELFGHERGAFTGAVKRRDGRFKTADGGTLLLDEVAEMSLSAQIRLLRVLQEGTIEPLGANTPLRVDVRVLSATHHNLRERIASGLFREDLYYRLNVLDIKSPPLRERHGDLALLFQHFARQFSPTGKPTPTISPRAWRKLESYSFPGNVRELQHAVERAVVLSHGKEIDLEHLPDNLFGLEFPEPTKDDVVQSLSVAVKDFERRYLLRALKSTAGRRARAAAILRISRKNLWEKLRTYGINNSEVNDPITPGPSAPTRT